MAKVETLNRAVVALLRAGVPKKAGSFIDCLREMADPDVEKELSWPFSQPEADQGNKRPAVEALHLEKTQIARAPPALISDLDACSGVANEASGNAEIEGLGRP